MFDMKCINNFVLLELDESLNSSASGIFIQTSAGGSNKARVISAGPECKYLKDGDIVQPNWVQCSQIELSGKKYYICVEANVVLKY